MPWWGCLPLRKLRTLPRREILADFVIVLDGHWSVALLEDILRDDVLLAEHLNGRPLDGDHGAPLRLVSPGEYGFINTKHLCRIELLTAEPATCIGSRQHRGAHRPPAVRLQALHPRARLAAGAPPIPPTLAGPRNLTAPDPRDPQAKRPPLTYLNKDASAAFSFASGAAGSGSPGTGDRSGDEVGAWAEPCSATVPSAAYTLVLLGRRTLERR
ncbi:MAG: molybdopterin-dependent oxidoreductase [Solirubrobacterales bacterium]|nr:molybdopterin-dependent oxidoreductase [Solirubrobacterales bacterium]